MSRAREALRPGYRLSRGAFLGSAAGLALVIATASGHAADRFQPRAPYTAPAPISAYSWTGPYLGGSLGYQSGRASGIPADPSGALGSLQGGYNQQFGRFVIGGEADMSFSGAEGRFAEWKFFNPWFGTLRVRGGFVLDRVLLYGTLGFALGGTELDFGGLAESKVHVGWTAGGGVEVGLAPHWSARVEYLFVDLADRSYPLTGVRQGLQSDVLRIGVHYRF